MMMIKTMTVIMLKLAHQNGSSWVTSQWLELSSTCIYTVYDWVIASTHYQAPQTQLSEEWIVRQCVDAVKWTGLVTSALFHIWTLTTQLAGRGAFVINCKDAGRVSRDNGGLFLPFIQRGSLMGSASSTRWENQQENQKMYIPITPSCSHKHTCADHR